MATERSVGDIACRFNTEMIEIQQYIGFVKAKSSIHLRYVLDLNKLLREQNLPEIPVRKNLGAIHYLTPEEIQKLLPPIPDITPKVHRKIQDLKAEQDFSSLDEGARFDQSLLGEWVAYLLDRMPVRPTPEDLSNLRQHALHEYERQRDTAASDQNIADLIDVALKYAVYQHHHQQRENLHDILDRFEELRIIAAAESKTGVTHILRQGFILLMAAFDATIFDLVRVALRKNFFALATAFGDKDKYTISDVTEAGSFEKFRDEIIEAQLTKRYIKGVLCLLDSAWKVPCVDKSSGHDFGRLIEINLRRNVHLHNRGQATPA